MSPVCEPLGLRTGSLWECGQGLDVRARIPQVCRKPWVVMCGGGGGANGR